MTMGRLPKLAWSVLGYNVAVVLWGAFVRASGSGAGCGRHWPTCNGEVIPQPKSVATMIEAAHRLTSGLAVIAVIALMIATFVALPKGHRARKTAGFATVSIFGEAIIGAGLVLFELVAHDASMKRALSMTLHLGNTFLLLGALALTAWWTTIDGTQPRVVLEPTRKPLVVKSAIVAALGSVLLLGCSGAIAALGDTLFPAQSLADGLAQDLSPLSHIFLKLRMMHPVIALMSGLVVFVAAAVTRALSGNRRAALWSRALTILFVAQFAAGVINITLLAPIAMQLVHLFLADATWIALVLMSWEATQTNAASVPVPEPSSPALSTS
jgi:heme A synthase